MRSLPRFLLATLVAATSLPAFAHAQELIGHVLPLSGFQTPHPYPRALQAGATVWTNTLSAPGARFLKLHFSDCHLTDGDYVLVKEPSGRTVDSLTSQRGTDFWALSVFGDHALIELHSLGNPPSAGFVVSEYGFGTQSPSCGSPGLCGNGNIRCALDIPAHQYIWDHHFATCAIIYVTGGNEVWSCTGWIIGYPNHIITNNHCLSTSVGCASTEAVFSARCSACAGGSLPTLHGFGCTQILCTASNLDYTVFEAFGSPADTYGQLTIEPRPIGVGESVGVPNYSKGREAQYDASTVTQVNGLPGLGDVAGADRIEQNARVAGGASGSPVLENQTGTVLALLHSSQSPSTDCGTFSRSVRMSSIWADMVARGCTDGVIIVSPPMPGHSMIGLATMAVSLLGSGGIVVALRSRRGRGKSRLG